MPADPSVTNYTCDKSKWLGLYGQEVTTSMNAVYQGCSPVKSFMVSSPNAGDTWSGSATAGCILGFGIFGIMYLFTIISIFWDINKRKAMYDADVEDDIRKLRDELGIDPSQYA